MTVFQIHCAEPPIHGGLSHPPHHRGTILCRSTMKRATPLRGFTSTSPRPCARTRALGIGHQTSNDGAGHDSFPPPCDGASMRLFSLARIRALRRAAPCPRTAERPSMAYEGGREARVPAGLHPPTPSSQPAITPPAPGKPTGNPCGGPLREPPRIPQLIRFGVWAWMIFTRKILILPAIKKKGGKNSRTIFYIPRHKKTRIRAREEAQTPFP